jgi:hypothetical protein
VRTDLGTCDSRAVGLRELPWAFTEHGALMAANVLHSATNGTIGVRGETTESAR